ncbi:hypothetical protein SADUNF_Sadunf19G0011400 [Salix dunnii]|uniref:Uncharacterized protein n=1 Tax=Salix dunnii TaxID=1413687 RepID=A0A835J152_9ROSI|nr:hypothetical protein SADUNF_Sadunf19G0011400 [Salix dunnii]
MLASVLGFFSRKDPLQGDFTEEIEEYLHHGVTKCIAFNRGGTLLAVILIVFGALVMGLGYYSDGPPYTPTAACFNKFGDLDYVGNSKGEILIIDHKSIQVHAMVPTPAGAVIKNIVFSRDGQCLLINSNVRTIRIYENLLPLKDGLTALGDLNKTVDEAAGVEKMKAVGSKCLALFREFQDTITKVHWKAPCFSGDGEWDHTENWSAFAPDFKELEEDEEYVDCDEFDLIPETVKVKESDINEDDDVDILTVEKDAFSDSDMSQ